MKKAIAIILFILLWASFAAAQQEMGEDEANGLEKPFGGHVRLGYRWVSLDGNPRAGEYEYLHSSAVGSLNFEWVPLPHRFMLESYYLNEKDFFNDLDYAYRDIVVLNLRSRGVFHNLDHYSFGPLPSDPTSPTFEDRNPGDQYGIKSELSGAFIRFKTPDFPFHLYAEARQVKKEGMIQQRFLRGYFGELHKVSESRAIDWETREVKVGANSHLGPVEIDYHHVEKRFEAGGEKVLFDPYPLVAGRAADTYPHNLVPDLKSSSDTVKLHTSYTGKLVAAATYSEGDKKNEDSDAKSEYWNAAGDVTYIPKKNVAVFVKYRHYDLDVNNPATATMPGANPANTYIYNVRDSISSKRDVLTGAVRYRPGDRWLLKGELGVKSNRRDVGVENTVIDPLQIAPAPPSGTAPAFWEVAHRSTTGTAKLGATYRVMSRLTLKADYRYADTDDPAYNKDPDTTNEAGISLTWTPTYKVSTVISARTVREKRKELVAPLDGGKREAAYDQALGSVTFLAGQRSSLTASYAYFDNRVDQTLTYHDGVGAPFLEPGLVPYNDTAHSGSLVFTHAYNESAYLTVEASRSYSRGKFRNADFGAGTTGIAEFSDLKVLEDAFRIGIEMQHNKRIGSELWYRYRDYDDKLDNTQDGTAQFLLATLSFKW